MVILYRILLQEVKTSSIIIKISLLYHKEGIFYIYVYPACHWRRDHKGQEQHSTVMKRLDG